MHINGHWLVFGFLCYVASLIIFLVVKPVDPTIAPFVAGLATGLYLAAFLK